jgi:hypothetical protein
MMLSLMTLTMIKLIRLWTKRAKSMSEENWGKRRKVAAREKLPRGREPVTNPLTLEERIRRKETRLSNRQQTRKNNLRMIRLLMRGVAEKLHSHRHIKHFKSDLHCYVESLFGDSHPSFLSDAKQGNLGVQNGPSTSNGPVSDEEMPNALELQPAENTVDEELPFANLKIDGGPKRGCHELSN